MRETRVLVHGAMSLDGFVVGPDHGRHTYEVGPRTKSPETRTAYGGSGTEFVLAHQAKSADDDAAVVFLSGRWYAGATGRAASGGKYLGVPGTDVTCLARGLLPVCRR